jgi:hypothetical protein
MKHTTFKQKICKICKKKYTPTKPLQQVCSISCAYKYSEKQVHKESIIIQKEKRKKQTQDRINIMTRNEWVKLAQNVFNKYIRVRDSKLPCISCQRHHAGQYHAGHYRTTGAAPQLRFNENNVHKQCSACNNHMSGNLIEYRINLIKKIGEDAVINLEQNSETEKYTISELQEIIQTYKSKIKEIEHQSGY